jgi:hypothetical protein
MIGNISLAYFFFICYRSGIGMVSDHRNDSHEVCDKNIMTEKIGFNLLPSTYNLSDVSSFANWAYRYLT